MNLQIIHFYLRSYHKTIKKNYYMIAEMDVHLACKNRLRFLINIKDIIYYNILINDSVYLIFFIFS